MLVVVVVVVVVVMVVVVPGAGATSADPGSINGAAYPGRGGTTTALGFGGLASSWCISCISTHTLMKNILESGSPRWSQEQQQNCLKENQPTFWKETESSCGPADHFAAGGSYGPGPSSQGERAPRPQRWLGGSPRLSFVQGNIQWFATHSVPDNIVYICMCILHKHIACKLQRNCVTCVHTHVQ